MKQDTMIVCCCGGRRGGKGLLSRVLGRACAEADAWKWVIVFAAIPHPFLSSLSLAYCGLYSLCSVLTCPHVSQPVSRPLALVLERPEPAMIIVDLTSPIFDGMPVYDGDPAVSVTTVRTRERDGWELRMLSFGSHTGTHVDAPIHMHAGGATLDEIPLGQFCGPARVVSPHDSVFPRGLGLLFVEPVTVATAAQLIEVSPPFVGGPIEEAAEEALLRHGIVTFTDLVNVEQLCEKTFSFYGFPLRIQHGDGSPVRAVAIIHEST